MSKKFIRQSKTRATHVTAYPFFKSILYDRGQKKTHSALIDNDY